MTFDKLSGNTVMVELTGDEMAQYAITYDTLDYSSDRTRSAVKKLLVRANELCSESDTVCERVTVEALPAVDGGCFFIFTFHGKKQRYRIKKSCEKLVLKAECINNILDFYSAVHSQRRGNANASLFRSEGEYYLTVQSDCAPPTSVMSEFGTVIKANESYIMHLREHGEYLGKITV